MSAQLTVDKPLAAIAVLPPIIHNGGGPNGVSSTSPALTSTLLESASAMSLNSTDAAARKPRRAISKSRRFEIFKRDGFACQYCGAAPPKAVLHVDHIIPVAKGGNNDDGNLTTACSICNGGKAARSLSNVPASLAERAALVAEQEAQLRGYSEVMMAQRDRIESDIWKVAAALYGPETDAVSRPIFQSIKTFVARLPLHEIIDAAEIATTHRSVTASRMFSYFCGICWNKIKAGEA